MYIVLIKRHPLNTQQQKDVINGFCTYLDNGYTYKEMVNDILNCFYLHNKFPFDKYNKKSSIGANLIKQGVIYYHKELKLINKFPTVNHDIDAGTLISEEEDYYLEQVASYTIDDLLKYFYSFGMANEQEYNYKRMYALFKYKINDYGLDKVLFMIEACARMYNAEQREFKLSDFEASQSIASMYLEEIQNNCKNTGGSRYYVTRKRKLFD